MRCHVLLPPSSRLILSYIKALTTLTSTRHLLNTRVNIRSRRRLPHLVNTRRATRITRPYQTCGCRLSQCECRFSRPSPCGCTVSPHSPSPWASILLLTTLILTLSCSTQGDLATVDPNPCYNIDLNWDDATDDPRFELRIQHQALTLTEGYVPGVVYQVSVVDTADNTSEVDTMAIKSVLNSTEESLVGAFGSSKFHRESDNNICSNYSRGVYVSQRAPQEETPQEGRPVVQIDWQAPGGGSGCVQFVLLILLKLQTMWKKFQQNLCERIGNFRLLFHESHGFSSNGYPREAYRDLYERTTLIQVQHGARIHLQFQEFYLEEPYKGHCVDYITVVSTENTTTPATRWCGRYTGPSLANLTFVSTHNYLIIRFLADGKEGRKGYQAQYYTVDESGHYACDSHLTEDSGSITSPNYPRPYFPNIHCKTLIRVPDNHVILLTIHTLSLQSASSSIDTSSSCRDSLSIRTSPFPTPALSSADNVTTLCGNVTDIVFESLSHWMEVVFSTDTVVESGGFLASYSTVKSCINVTYSVENDTLSSVGHNGTLSSLGYPSPYPVNQTCRVTLHSDDPHRAVMLQFIYLHTETNSGVFTGDDCTEDYVEVFDGAESIRRCGDWRGYEDNLQVHSVGDTLTVTFVTDGTGNAGDSGGFLANWFTVVNDTLYRACHDGWRREGSMCFLYVSEPATWHQAETECEFHDASLVTIHNRQQQDFIYQYLSEERPEFADNVWIGANDEDYEADYFWVDGTAVNYTDWFPGWPQFGYYGRQPSDDGLSREDCVEIRKTFMFPSKGEEMMTKPYWNDRECEEKNAYICQKRMAGGGFPGMSDKHLQTECSGHLELTVQNPSVVISSPGFPKNYHSFLDCHVMVDAPDGWLLEVEFTSFHLEDDDLCRYDWLTVTSAEGDLSRSDSRHSDGVDRQCGDWSERLRLLRTVTSGQRVDIRFVTDHSYTYQGYSANVSLLNGSANCDENVWNYQDKDSSTCYLATSDKALSWQDARHNCILVGGDLPSLHTPEQVILIETMVKNTAAPGRTLISDGFFWVGGRSHGAGGWSWSDDTHYNHTVLDGTSLSQRGSATSQMQAATTPSWSSPQASLDQDRSLCLAVMWDADRVRWLEEDCVLSGGFICLKSAKTTETIRREEHNMTDLLTGHLYSIGFTSQHDYPTNLYVVWYITVPDDFRIMFLAPMLDLEYHTQCLYDFVRIRDILESIEQVFCGVRSGISYATIGSEAEVQFYSDYKVTSAGFHIEWEAVNVTDVDDVIYTWHSGLIQSLNYPVSYLNDLQQTLTIRAPTGYRIFLNMLALHLAAHPQCADYLNIHLDNTTAQGMVQLCAADSESIHNLKFISKDNTLILLFHTDSFNNSAGFNAAYVTHNASELFTYTEELHVTINETGVLRNVNYLLPYPYLIQVSTTLVAPLGYQIMLETTVLHLPWTPECHQDSLQLLQDFLPDSVKTERAHVLCGSEGDPHLLNVTSYLNRITVRLHTGEGTGETHNGYVVRYTIEKDPAFFPKTLISYDVSLPTCDTQPCLNGGTCSNSTGINRCTCTQKYTGWVCWATVCQVSPCENRGRCTLTSTSYNCSCPVTHGGRHCHYDIAECGLTRCHGNGHCHFDASWNVYCLCDEGWKAASCSTEETPDTESDRGLGVKLMEEPFWIGIIVVLGVVLVTCIVVFIRKKCLRYCKCDWCCQFRKRRTSENGNAAEEGNSTRGSHAIQHLVPSRLYPTTSSVEITPTITNKTLQMPAINVQVVEDVKDSTMLIPPLVGGSQRTEAGAKLFAAYNGGGPLSKSNSMLSLTSNEEDVSSGVKDGKLTFHNSPPQPLTRSRSAKVAGEEAGEKQKGVPSQDYAYGHHKVGVVDDLVLNSHGRHRKSLRTKALLLKTCKSLQYGTRDSHQIEAPVSIHRSASDQQLNKVKDKADRHKLKLPDEEQDSGNSDFSPSLYRHQRMNSAQRRKDFANAVRMARHLTQVAPDSTHSSSSVCRSCGSHCSITSFDSSYETASQRFNSNSSKSVECPDCDSQVISHGRKCSHDGGVPMTRTNSPSSVHSCGSHRHRHHRHRHHKRHHSRHGHQRHSSSRSHGSHGSRSRRETRTSISLDIPDIKPRRSSRHCSQEDDNFPYHSRGTSPISGSNRDLGGSHRELRGSNRDIGGSHRDSRAHRKLQRSTANDWHTGSLSNIRRGSKSPESNPGIQQAQHRRLELTRSDTSTESHQGWVPPRPRHRMHKSRSMDPQKEINMNNVNISTSIDQSHHRGHYYDSEDVTPSYSYRGSRGSSQFASQRDSLVSSERDSVDLGLSASFQSRGDDLQYHKDLLRVPVNVSLTSEDESAGHVSDVFSKEESSSSGESHATGHSTRTKHRAGVYNTKQTHRSSDTSERHTITKNPQRTKEVVVHNEHLELSPAESGSSPIEVLVRVVSPVDDRESDSEVLMSEDSLQKADSSRYVQTLVESDDDLGSGGTNSFAPSRPNITPVASSPSPVGTPSMYPMTDSAYQSNEQSTDKTGSRPTSSGVSPASAASIKIIKDELMAIYQPTGRSEDRRVTNQLELAARKLTALSEEEAAQVYEEEMQLADQTANVAKQNGTLSFYFHDALSLMPPKQRRLFPSRMLSMIADEEYEGSDHSVGATPTRRDQGSDHSVRATPTRQDQNLLTLTPEEEPVRERSLDSVRTSPVDVLKQAERASPVDGVKKGDQASPVHGLRQGERMSPVDGVKQGDQASPVHGLIQGERLSPVDGMKQGERISPVDSVKQGKRTSPVGVEMVEVHTRRSAIEDVENTTEV